MTREHKGETLLFLAAFIGGAGFVSMKYLLEWGFTPFQIIAGRFFIGTVIMLLVYGKKALPQNRETWKAGGIVGFLLFCLFSLMTVGLQYTTPSVNAFLANTQAMLVPLLAWIFWRKKPTSLMVWGAVITFIGVCFLSVRGDFSLDFGAVLSFLSAVCFSLQMIILGDYVKRLPPLPLTLIENGVVFLLSFLVALFGKKPLPLMTLGAWGNFLLLGIFCTAIYFAFQSVGQQSASPSKTAIIITSESVFTVVIAAFFYGERLDFKGYFGCALIFFAVLLVEGNWALLKDKMSG